MSFKGRIDSIKKSSMFYIIYAAILLAFAGSVVLMIEDFGTSYLGYLGWPTKKINPELVGLVVAALPQLVPIVFGYKFLESDGEDKRYALIAIVAFLFDFGTDVGYKSQNFQQNVGFAVGESLFVFTVASELLFTVTGALLLDLTPYLIKRILGNVAQGASTAVTGALGMGSKQQLPKKQAQQTPPLFGIKDKDDYHGN